MNPVLVLTYNNLELNKRCIESVRAQNIPTYLYVWDNGSTDGTADWLSEKGVVDMGMMHPENKGVSYGWNCGLDDLFENEDVDRVLVANSDVILPPWMYRKLASFNLPFVTGVSVGTPEEVPPEPPDNPLVEGPDFSLFCISRECWRAVGPFDAEMKNYASDNAFHVEAHRKRIKLMNAQLPFLHFRSSTIRNADKRLQRELCLQADADREVFRSKYGCLPWEDKYRELFT